MYDFTCNHHMTNDEVIAYVRVKLPEFFGQAELTCKEIGDGNINYVYRIADGKRSLIVKHAEPVVRSSGSAASTDRSRIEAKILALQQKLAPGHVPELYLYDPQMRCMLMEDLVSFQNLRYALLNRETFPTLAEDMAEFMAATLMRTTDLILPAAQKKELTKQFINPDMCAITERLVFTCPYRDTRESNVYTHTNREFLLRQIAGDNALVLEAAKLKNLFQTKAQCLIHGDLHSGSIFVKSSSTMVLDPEFAFFGPAGYDVGNVLAHYIFAWANCYVTEVDPKRRDFLTWLEETIIRTLDLFYAQCTDLLKKEGHDVMYSSVAFLQAYLRDLLKDTAGFCGTELLRRVIGSAKVRDLTCIESEQARFTAEKICVYTAKELILNRDMYAAGADYVQVLHRACSRL